MNGKSNNRSAGIGCRPFFALLLLLAAAVSCGASSVSLEDLLRRSGAALRWDPWRHTGALSRDGVFLTFRPGDPWMVLNGKDLISTGSVLEENGRLVFSQEAADTVFEVFGVGTDGDPYVLSTILIDPGHGGRDAGAGKSWPIDDTDYPIHEKDVVLELSLRLVDELKRTYPDKRILLTRDSDTYPSLEERVAVANDVDLRPREGMIYISVHANASLSPTAEGFEVWYLPRDYRRELVDPGSLGGGGSSIAPIVNALWEEEFTHESVRLADFILQGFRNELGSDVPDRGRREESWFVVRNARMASVLIEVGFLTNSSEVGRLRHPEYLSRITRGIYNGVVDFVTYFETREY